MKFAGLRRPIIGVTCAATMVAWAFAGTSAQAQVANPNQIPANSAYILSIPDGPKFWSAWKANSIYSAYRKAVANPQVAEKMGNFTKELATIESVLGYKLNGDTISQIFKSVDLYAAAGENAGENKVGAVLGISDKDKLNKLLDLAEKAAAEAVAEDAESTETEKKDDASTSAISSEEYAGVTIKRFSTGDDQEIFYTLAGEQLLASNGKEEIRALIDRSKGGEATANTLGSDPNYKKVTEALASQVGEAYIFGSQKAIMEMQQGGMGPLGELTKQFSPVDFYGSSINVEPKEIRSKTHGILAADAANTLVGKNPGDKPLEVLNYVPGNAMVVFATSLLDSQILYKLIGDAAGQDLDQQAQGLEMMLGFSVKNDLLPALGNEMGFALNSVKMSGGAPDVDAALLFRVADKAKMQKVMSGIERLATNALANQAGTTSNDSTVNTSAKAGEFKEEKVGEATLRYVEVPIMPSLTPGYVMDGDYILIGSTRAAMKSAVENKGGASSLPQSEKIKALGSNISTTGNVFQFVNFEGIWDTVDTVAKMFPQGQEAQFLIDSLKVIRTAAGVSRVKEGALVSEGVLQLQ